MSFREKIEKSKEAQTKPVAANNNEQVDVINGEYFGVENIRNSLDCIDFRFADGTRKALPYSYVMEINYNSKHEIEILTPSKKIKITGRFLMRLYNYLIAFRIKYIHENIGTDVNEDGIFVKEIIIEEI